MQTLENLIKKYHIGLSVIAVAIVFMTLFGLIRLKGIKIDQEQIIESEDQGHFIARYSDIYSIAVSIDSDDKIDGSLELVFRDYSYNELGSYVIPQDAVMQNAFGEKCDIKNRSLELEQGKKYSVEVLSSGKQLKNVSVMICGDPISILPLYMCACLMIIGGLILVTFCYYSSKCSFAIKFLLTMCTLGLISNFVMKPLNVPDETIHFAQSYEIANRLLGEKTSDDNIVFYQSGIIRSLSSRNAQDAYNFWTDYSYGNHFVEITSKDFQKMTNIPTFIYLPGAVGIAISRLFRMPYQFVIVLGRLTNLLFFTMIAMLSIKVCHSLRYVIASVCFLPSTVWLITSYSYDAWNLEFIILFFSICIRIREQECCVRIRDVIFLLLTFILFAPIKFVYIVMGLCIIFIPRKKWDKKTLSFVSVAIVLSIAAVLITRGREVAALVLTPQMDIRGAGNAEKYTSYTLSWVLENPISTLLVFFKSIWENSVYYIRTAFAGELYNEPNIPSFLAALVIIVYLLLMPIAIQDIKFKRKDKVSAQIVIILGSLAVYVAFLFVYSIIPNNGIGKIAGIQGRYFIPYIILLPIAFQSDRVMGVIISSDNQNMWHDLTRTILYVMVILNLCVMFSKFSEIVTNSFQFRLMR